MKFTPYTERDGADAWDRLEEALRRYFEAEDRALLAAFGRCPDGPALSPTVEPVPVSMASPLRSTIARGAVMAYGDLPIDAPHKPNKGKEGGACNRQRCQAEPALWWNHGSHSWYCADCARDIGQDVVNLRHWNADWLPKCGHPQFETREQMNARKRAATGEECILDPFADARMGVSLFQMGPADWVVREPAQGIEAGTDETRQGLGAKHESPVGEADAPNSQSHREGDQRS